MRLVNDEQHRPNLQLFCWPEVPPEGAEVPECGLPQRWFLIARHSIPPLTELSWDYGDMYAACRHV